MSDAIISFLQHYNLKPEIIVFIISMIPVIELRGGIIAAKLFGIPLMNAYIICVIGNILPIPFILLFIKKIFKILKRFKFTAGIVNKLEERAMKKSENMQKKQLAGLLAFVAVPLPGTGGWTGSLVASLLNMPVHKSFVTITFGVMTAGVIMLILSYFIPGLFGF